MKINLNGEWCLHLKNPGIMNFPKAGINAKVPGDIHRDLLKAGLLPDPYYGLNTLEAEKWERKEWVFTKTFSFVPPDRPFKARLLCKGLDYQASLSLNGKPVGTAQNALVEHEFDVSDALRDGENTLTIELNDGLSLTDGKELKRYAAQEEAMRRLWLRKPQFTFGWDWAPRLITCGIWREVELETSEPGFLRNDFFRSEYTVGQKSARIHGSIDFEANNPAQSFSEHSAVLTVSLDGKVIEKRNISFRNGPNQFSFELKNPKLWYPAGYGAQPLYDFIFTPEDHGIAPVSGHFAIRDLRLDESVVPEGGSLYSFLFNGKRTFLTGGNWVPADSMIGSGDFEKVRFLLKDLIRGNGNALRVWGGGVYESESFYDLCDRFGIVIFQDFMYACSLYPDDDSAFLDNAVREAEKAVLRLRRHPCIIQWFGNNEIYDGYEEVWHIQTDRLYGEKLFDNLLPGLLERLAPGSIYRHCSPDGGAFHRSDQTGDSHTLTSELTREERLDFRRKLLPVGRMMMEYYEWTAPPEMKTLLGYLPEGERSLLSGAYRHHANGVFVKRELEPFKAFLSEDPDSMPLEYAVKLMQDLQAEHLGAMTRMYLRNLKICSGALYWMYNDCWPTSSWTAHDYYARRKPLFYHMKRAFAPVMVSLRETDGGMEFFVTNRTAKAFRGKLCFGRYRFLNGETVAEYEKEVFVKAMSTVRAGFFYTTMGWPWETIRSFIYARLEDGEGTPVGNARHWFTSIKGMTLKDFSFPAEYWEYDTLAVPEIRIQTLDRTHLKVTADIPAFGIRLNTDEFLPDDNCFDLLPSEKKTIALVRPLPDDWTPEVQTQNRIIVFLREGKQ